MSSDLWRYLIAGVIILHGIGHAGAPWLFTGSWVAPGLAQGVVRWLFVLVWLVVAAGFIAVGIGVLQQQAWWRPLAVAMAALSLVIAGLFFGGSTNQPLINASGMDIIILIALLLVRWPSPDLIGA